MKEERKEGERSAEKSLNAWVECCCRREHLHSEPEAGSAAVCGRGLEVAKALEE